MLFRSELSIDSAAPLLPTVAVNEFEVFLNRFDIVANIKLYSESFPNNTRPQKYPTNIELTLFKKDVPTRYKKVDFILSSMSDLIFGSIAS